jgi:uncharacterized protein (DUF433 family)
MDPGAAFTTDQVIRLTGVTRRKLTYWLDRGIVTADIDAAKGRGHVRLWSFTNLVEVRTALWLRDQVSLQLLGKVVQAIRATGLKSPLAEVTVRVAERPGRSRKTDVEVLDPAGVLSAPATGQYVMELKLPMGRFHDDLTKAIDLDRKRRRVAGRVERRRGHLGSTAVFAGTRIPVVAVQRLLEAGWSTRRIIGEFPGLSQADIRTARDGVSSARAG